MKKEDLNAVEVRAEVDRLKNSSYVQLAIKEEAIRCREWQHLRSLRELERKGRALAGAGITIEVLENMDTEEAFDFYAGG